MPEKRFEAAGSRDPKTDPRCYDPTLAHHEPKAEHPPTMATNPTEKMSPAMAQYHRWKKEFPAEILFFQMGDFFEMFYDDAKVVSEVLGLTLTSRSKGPDAIPMAGVPVKSVDLYLKKLVTRGYRVAICDQIEDPREANGVVERAVTRVVTAGTLTEEDLLDRSAPNYLAAIHPSGDRVGLAFLDLSTGEFRVAEPTGDELADVLTRVAPAEVLFAESRREETPIKELGSYVKAALTARPAWQFEPRSAREALFEHFRVKSLDGFGIDAASPAIESAGAALRYLQETQRTDLSHLNPPRFEGRGERLTLDRATRSCLELTETVREGKRDGSLLQVIDQTITAMGARRLRAWLLAPLSRVDPIRARQAAVAELVEDRAGSARLKDSLRRVADMERLLTRVVTMRANARDLVQLRHSLASVPDIRSVLAPANASELSAIRERLDPREDLGRELAAAIDDDPPLSIKDGGIIRDGYDGSLDELRAIHRDGRTYLLQYQSEEIERTGIQNLKVGFNRVFGFYIEVTNSFKNRVPDDFIRKQTLKNAERYITPRLKEYETKVLTAEERAKDLEIALFERIREMVTRELEPLQTTAAALAELDAILSLSEVAALHGYARPEVDDAPRLEIVDGRHPVLAARLGASVFVPNDCVLDTDSRRLAIVTGPNMAGKSTFIRQVALIQILAQVGSFVPAKRAAVGVCDRVFARVGASDDLAHGSSTFMVEMTETANILNNATSKSLVILDEVGRGTSTFDGLAIAWAISEHLLETTRTRTLFATHYHQLIDLAATYPAVCNLNVSVREWGEEIVFLHQIVEGGSDRSYGIHVARLAGVPRPVLERATRILRDLEKNHVDLRPAPNGGPEEPKARRTQATLFETREAALVRELAGLDPDRLTPLDALLKLREWKERFSSQR